MQSFSVAQYLSDTACSHLLPTRISTGEIITGQIIIILKLLSRGCSNRMREKCTKMKNEFLFHFLHVHHKLILQKKKMSACWLLPRINGIIMYLAKIQ